ncbi:MAG TPA: methyltransferase [Actinophytocola sp.]|uniref:methyltransferase n=1 Tax=Actinophytocola sp. TaxID=1872138 RepID=UPI002F931F91
MASSSQHAVPAHLRLRELITGSVLAKATATLCELGVPDALTAKRTSAELAAEVGADPDTLLPFLRLGCAGGVLAEVELRVFELTDLGRLLRSDAPDSEAALCMLVGREEVDHTLAKATRAARTGEPMFTAAYGKPFSEYVSSTPDFARLYDVAMAGPTGLESLLAACDFAATRHVVDVGGGRGAVLSAILRRYRHLQATLVDLPHVVEGARPVLARAGVGDRVTLAAGSFFDGVPATGDVYLLSRVIGDWSDAEALRILANVRSAMSAGDRLVIVGNMPSANDRTTYPVALSFYMFALMGVRTRTYDEYEELLGQSGLRIGMWANFPDGESVLEAVPA